MILKQGHTYLPIPHDGKTIWRIYRGGRCYYKGTPYSLAATQALKAAFPQYWTAIRDYGWANPQLVPFINEDPMLIVSLVEVGKRRWLRWGSGTWVRTGVPYSQNIETDVIAMPDSFGTLQLIAREGGSYSSYQFSFFNGGYSSSTGGSYDKTNLGFAGGNVYDVRYNAEGDSVIVNGKTYGVTLTGSGTQSIVFGTRSGSTWYIGYFGVAKIINKDTGELLRWYAPFIRNGEAMLLNLLDGTPADVVSGTFTIQVTDKAT